MIQRLPYLGVALLVLSRYGDRVQRKRAMEVCTARRSQPDWRPLLSTSASRSPRPPRHRQAPPASSLLPNICSAQAIKTSTGRWWVLFENRPALYFLIRRKIKKNYTVCWIPYLLMILSTLPFNIFINGIVIIGNKKFKQYLWYGIKRYTFYSQ